MSSANESWSTFYAYRSNITVSNYDSGGIFTLNCDTIYLSYIQYKRNERAPQNTTTHSSLTVK